MKSLWTSTSLASPESNIRAPFNVLERTSTTMFTSTRTTAAMKPTWQCCNCYSQIQSMTKNTCFTCKHSRCKFCRILSRKLSPQLHESHIRHSAFAESKENKKTEAEMRRQVVVLDNKEPARKTDADLERHVEVTKSKKTAKTVMDGEERHC